MSATDQTAWGGFGFNVDAISEYWNAAAAANSDPEFNAIRTPQTITSNAIDSMAPVQQDAGGWTSFWQGIGKTALSYAITRDAVTNGIGVQQQSTGQGGTVIQTAAQAGATQRAGLAGSPLLLLVGVGLLGYFLANNKG